MSTDDVVELIGGPRDGDLFTLPGDVAGFEWLRVPIPSTHTIRLAHLAGLLGPYPIALDLQVALYRRDAISDVTHRWRYVYEP